jgi:hypothetical protein
MDRRKNEAPESWQAQRREGYNSSGKYTNVGQTSQHAGRGPNRFAIIVPDINLATAKRLSVTTSSSVAANVMLADWLPHEPRAVIEQLYAVRTLWGSAP